MGFYISQNRHHIDTVVILILFIFFTITTFFLVLTGAKQYQSVVNSSDTISDNRTCASYLAQKIRQNNRAGAISVTDINGTSALTMTEQVNGTSYTTYIYAYGGSLRELLTNQTDFSLESGQAIFPAQDFQCTIGDNRLLRMIVTTSDGSTQQVNAYLVHRNHLSQAANYN